jgi:ribosomal protein S10
MSPSDYRIRCLIQSTRDETAIRALRELLQHRAITRAILAFERDPVATSFESIVRMAHQIHDKKPHPAPKRKERRSIQEAIDQGRDSIQAERFHHTIYNVATQVEERCRG